MCARATKRIDAAALAALLLLVPVAALCADAEYRFKTAFGRSGKGPGQFDHPLGVAVDASGGIFVTDWGNKRVQVFRSDGSFARQFDVRAKLGKRGGAKGPTGIVAAESGDLFVADQDSDTVKRFARDGRPLAQFGQHGSWLERFKEPRGICVDRFDNLYVADMENYRVQKFTLAGEYLNEIKYKDVISQQFAKPRGVACDRDGNLCVVYSDIARVVLFDREGRTTREFGVKGRGEFEFLEPRYVAIDNLGHIHVTDFALSKVVKLDRGLAPLSVIGTGGGDGALLYPEGVAVDPAGQVYVADSGRNRVVVYEPPERVRRLNYAYLYAHRGDYEAAAAEFEGAWRIDPADPQVKEGLIDTLVRGGGKALRADERPTAIRLFRRALEIDPLNAYAIRELKDLEAIPAAARKGNLRNLIAGSLVALAVFLSFMMAFGHGGNDEEDDDGTGVVEVPVEDEPRA